MIQVIQDVGLATPLLVVAASEVSAECKESMKELCRTSFEISSKNFPHLVKACEEYNVDVPNTIVVQPILCNTINDFIVYQNTLDQENYQTFLKFFCTLVFIDYSVNKNIDESKSFFLNCDVIKPDRISFVIYKASETLFSYHSDTTCVCFNTFSITVAISCIQDFIARSISMTAINLLDYGFNRMAIESKVVREAKVRADFAGISNNIKSFIHEVKLAHKELESKDANYEIQASFYEIMGLLEQRNPGSLHSHKLMPSNTSSVAFNWMPSFTQRPMMLFIAASNIYNKISNYGRCIDCGLRIIISGYKDVIQPVAHYITANAKQKGVLSRTWDLLNVVERFGMVRRAALLASQFSKTFEYADTSNTFTLFALNVLLKDSSSSSLVQIRDLCIPMMMSLINEKKKVPPKVYSKFLAKTLSAIGPALPKDEQANLFTELEGYSCKKINLPLVMSQMEVDKLPYTITKQEKKRRSGSGVFLYSYLSTKENVFEVTVDVNHSITVSATLENPFSIHLKAEDVHLIADINATIEHTTEYFRANSRNTIHSHITPYSIGECVIRGISMNFYGATQSFMLQNPLLLNVVDTVPNFHVRTDLPLSSSLSLYDGEIHEFTLWVTNLGGLEIANLNVNFLQPELARLIQGPDLPLAPQSQTTIRCAVTAVKGEEFLGVKIVANCAKSDYCCSQNIRQKLIITDSLEICRIYLMTTPPRGEKALDKIFIGYEVRNLASCSFMYKSVLCENETSGLIGQNESLMMVGSYRPSDLISNGTDANKMKLIAMTKLKEAEIGKSLSLTQRIRVSKCVSMLQRLQEKWKFEWTVSSIRKGELISKAAAVDDELFNGIVSRQIQAKTDWFKDTAPVDKISIDTKYTLAIEFDKEMAQCGLDLTFENDENDINDILWEGELNQKDEQGKRRFEFVLCFGSPKMIKFYVCYTSNTGIEGQTLVSVAVQE